VQVQLRDEITEGGEVDFCAVKMLFDETCDHGALFHDLIALCGRQIQQIGDVYFRYQYELREQRVPVQQYVAVFQSAQGMGVGEQLLMYYELRQG
jgi:GNAT superfamily N-acetyltransferase